MTSDFPEAPASVTYSLVSPKGFPALFTIRDEKVDQLTEKMKFMESYFEKSGYKPQVKGFVKKEIEYVEGRVCPECGGRLIKKTTKEGNPMIKCENGKYDFIKKVNTGCPFTEWPK